MILVYTFIKFANNSKYIQIYQQKTRNTETDRDIYDVVIL